MSLHNQYTYPAGSPINPQINVGDLQVTMPPSEVKRDYEQFLLADDIKKFSPIAMKPLSVGFESYKWHILTAVGLTTGFDLSPFKRRLMANVGKNYFSNVANTTDRKMIKINRPEGKKAYLHAVSYAMYDYNTMIPKVTADTYGDVISMLIDNAFGTGASQKGLPVGLPMSASSADSEMIDVEAAFAMRSETITSAHYPIFRRGSTSRQDELRVMEYLNQSAPRSSVRFGMLPTDYFINNFELTIGGFEDPTSVPARNASFATTIYETAKVGNDSYGGNAYADGEQVNRDTMVPAYNNEIDIEIPDNIVWMAADVIGGGWEHCIELSCLNTNVKGEPQAQGHIKTFVQMPVKVLITVRYA